MLKTDDLVFMAIMSIGNFLSVCYAYDGDGTITSTLDRDLDFNQNLNINDHGYINRLTNNQRQLINKINPSDTILYELTEYVLERNQEYSQVLMQRDGAGFLSTTYTYGNQRINTESINNLSGIYTYDGRGSVSAVIGGWGDFRATYWYDGLGNVKSQIHGYGAFGSGKRYFGYNAEQYNPLTGNQNLRNRQVSIRRQRFLTEDTYLGNQTDTLSINRYIYARNNPLKYKDQSGYAPVIIPNQNISPGSNEPYIIKQDGKEYFIRNGAEPAFSMNGDNFYVVSGDIEVKDFLVSMIHGITSISTPGYQDDSLYATDNIYELSNYITATNPNTRFIQQKEHQLGNISFIIGTGLGGKFQLTEGISLSAQVRYASEKDLLYNCELRGVLNVETKILDTGISLNQDYINRRIYDDYTLFRFSKNGSDLIWTFGIEAYLGIGGGFSGHVNLSEIMRRARNMISGKKCRYD